MKAERLCGLLQCSEGRGFYRCKYRYRHVAKGTDVIPLWIQLLHELLIGPLSCRSGTGAFLRCERLLCAKSE
jgi:hypothetical protein